MWNTGQTQKKHVVLHYSRDEDGEQFHEVDMPNVYAGIFVETFVVFFGEEIQYYITEEYKNKVVSTESNRLTCNDIYAQKDESRYNLINQMLISETLSDEVSMFQTMKQYAGYDEVTKKYLSFCKQDGRRDGSQYLLSWHRAERLVCHGKLYATEYGRTGDGQHDCRQ